MADEELKRLVRERGIIKSKVTQFEKYLYPLKLAEPSLISKQIICELQLKLTRLQDAFSQFDKVQYKIETIMESDEQSEERETLESRFCSLISYSQCILEEAQNLKSPHPSRANSVTSSTDKSVINVDDKSVVKPNDCAVSDREHTNFHQSNIKLPTIPLPTFDGNHSKWLEYRDTFDALINKNNSIPTINKFHYLRSSLEGGAAIVIKSIEFTADNYDTAWSLLCERFNNKRILINNHLKALFNFDVITKESFKSLRYMIDYFSKNLNSLQKLKEPTEYWDSLIIFMMAAKLDPSTGRNWEEYKSTLHSSPTFDIFIKFLRGRADMLETLQYNKSDKPSQHEHRYTKSFLTSSGDSSNSCVLCDKDHPLYVCEKFNSLSVEDRMGVVNKYKLCNNCLRSGHHCKQCRLSPCRFCRRKHNSLLHAYKYQSSTSQDNNSKESKCNCTTTSSPIDSPAAAISTDSSAANACTGQSSVALSATMSGQVLLCTAEVDVVDPKTNKIHQARVLLDSGSQSSFIIETMQRKMDIKCKNMNLVNVSGINNSTTKVTQCCQLIVRSRVNHFQIEVSCLVIPQITSSLPSVEVDTSRLNIPSNVVLADSSFWRPSDIQLLLGADVFWDIVNMNHIKLGRNKPTLQDSKLGWLVTGPICDSVINISSNVQCNFVKEILPDFSKFWELEEVTYKNRILTKNEELCETHFVQNTKRLPDGRFRVKIPLNESPEAALGESYYIAKRRFLNLEKKLSKSSQRDDYAQFINEYERLGHLTEIERPSFGYYIPHHAVIRESSETTRLRVVFDGSCKTSSGKSFNDIQLVGPVVQDDLLSILLRFRQNAYVVTGDIEKMYRQIMVDESQRHLQLIIWRENVSQPLKILQLNTVTYGTASAPYLSTRCVVQLADECADEAVANAIRHDFYVDDLNTGSNSKTELKHIVKGVIDKLSEACLPLRKFRTNAPEIFEDIVTVNQIQDFSKDSSVLGLKWAPNTDILQFSADVVDVAKITKRSILSASCQIFDPLGLLSACTIVPKMLLQKLWLLKLDWDEQVPIEIQQSWKDFVNNLPNITSIQVPRHVLCNEPLNIEVHCFTDASQNAYGACLYLKSNDSFGNVKVNLLCAKARVAPLKPEMTIPRMELLGALLGARLYTKVIKSLRIQVSSSVFWSDSSIVLGWLRTQPKTLKTFVCNRINEIRELTDQDSWRHIPTHSNPADLLSRGSTPQGLRDSVLHWHGPTFLTQPESEWPRERHADDTPLPETKIITLKVQCQDKIINFDNYSKLYKLQRIMAYVLRFASRNKVKGILTAQELERSLTILAKLSQQESFPQDIHSLNTQKKLHCKSRILSLNPFLDNQGILRVGGRIDQASHCHYDKRHPIMIDAKHHFTKLLFEKEHQRLLHCGPQQLLFCVRDQFWPTGGRMLARSTVNKCVRCRRFRAATIQPLMGDLPQPRVIPGLPFDTCGTDFAGPFLISSRKGRGAKTSKCYLCIFICLSTKAVHLEAVSDLSTNGFILCLRRFVARRGKPHTIYCDNGKNFVGAMNELGRLLRACNREVGEYASSEGITFKFSPAYSPNFGGIWEAGVKAAKYHVKRVAGNTSLTFEELSTLFATIESILNSRPLTPFSSDPSDLRALTPGHFLIGRPLTSLPSPSMERLTVNRYQLIERLRQGFWDRWTKEYLSEVQTRCKWKTNNQTISIGDLVIIKDEQLPVLKWLLGRIIKLYPGPDGVCRVVDVKTSKGILRRALSRLCPLLETSAFKGAQDVNAD